MFAPQGCDGPVAQRLSRGLIIQERVFSWVFTALRTIADARCFKYFAFAPRYAELRRFAAKNCHTVETDREKFASPSRAHAEQVEGAANEKPFPVHYSPIDGVDDLFLSFNGEVSGEECDELHEKYFESHHQRLAAHDGRC